MDIKLADRLSNLPPYLFAKIDAMKAEVQAKGMDVLDFGVGDPDLPTPDFIVKALKEGLTHKNYHQYPSYSGTDRLKETIAKWFKKRFNVQLDPKKEIIVLIGSKEGIAHTPLSLVNPGEKVLYSSPGYPVYKIATEFAGGQPIEVPLKIENQFLPDLETLDTEAKLFFLNYPNNPTSATAPVSYLEKLTQWAKKTNTILCHDAAYTEIYYDGEPTKSILEIPGAKDVAVEFHSLSKTFNMTGWRVGFAVGNATLIEALSKMKTNIDSGQFLPVQHAACVALEKGDAFVEQQRTTFKRRRDMLMEGLKKIGLEVFPCKATFYLWVKTPKQYNAVDFSALLLQKLGIVTTPGVGFGAAGEGFIRFSFTVPNKDIQEAIKRLSQFSL